MYRETLQKIHHQEDYLKLHVLLHTGNNLTLDAFWSTAKSTMPPQHYKEILNMMQKDAK